MQALSACFGLDYGKDKERSSAALELIPHLWIKPESIVDGIHYYDADALPLYDVTRDEFLKGELMDFISICMVSHHLHKPGEPFERLPFSSLNIIDPNGRVLRDEIAFTTCLSCQKSHDRLLKRLKIGGILFADLHSGAPRHWLEHECDDLFFILKRVSDDTFIFYNDHPIPFRPNGDEFSPSREFSYAYPGWEPEFYTQVQFLFDRADMLAYRFQAWKKSVWATPHRIPGMIRGREPLEEIFSAYLENVPDDNSLKRKILDEARSLSL